MNSERETRDFEVPEGELDYLGSKIYDLGLGDFELTEGKWRVIIVKVEDDELNLD